MPNSKKIPRNAEFMFIEKYTKGATSILDYGCGIGETLRLYPPDAYTVGVDFVDTYQTQWIANGGMAHYVQNIYEEPMVFGERFDVGVLAKVLLHCTPEQINTVIQQMVTNCNRLIITTAITPPEVQLSEWCFNHDYEAIFKQYGMRLLAKDNEGVQHFYYLEC
jgi:2-polyprenyl-3-methyl-5-hydroxy-6-metoxy-1,4-benzoquinol methylase